MKSISISGLIIRLNVGGVVYLTRRDQYAAVADITLAGTCPADRTATLAIGVGGERVDVLALGLPPEGATAVISSAWATEVLPGVHVAIRGGCGFLTARSVSLVIDAHRDRWSIERGDLAEKKMLAPSRVIPFRRHSRDVH
jgi:hypothetical protein